MAHNLHDEKRNRELITLPRGQLKKNRSKGRNKMRTGLSPGAGGLWRKIFFVKSPLFSDNYKMPMCMMLNGIVTFVLPVIKTT
jgi:hypothetical protein